VCTGHRDGKGRGKSGHAQVPAALTQRRVEPVNQGIFFIVVIECTRSIWEPPESTSRQTGLIFFYFDDISELFFTFFLSHLRLLSLIRG
jgi:hypothetical protein